MGKKKQKETCSFIRLFLIFERSYLTLSITVIQRGALASWWTSSSGAGSSKPSRTQFLCVRNNTSAMRIPFVAGVPFNSVSPPFRRTGLWSFLMDAIVRLIQANAARKEAHLKCTKVVVLLRVVMLQEGRGAAGKRCYEKVALRRIEQLLTLLREHCSFVCLINGMITTATTTIVF